jgi:hypothetical protein
VSPRTAHLSRPYRARASTSAKGSVAATAVTLGVLVGATAGGLFTWGHLGSQSLPVALGSVHVVGGAYYPKAGTVAPQPSAGGPNSSPSGLPAGSAVTYDPKDRELVLFGPSVSTALGVTWTYQAGKWSQLNVTVAPSNRSGAMISYDPVAKAVILFGGVENAQGGATSFPNDTWSFSGGVWTNVTTQSPQAPSGRWGGGLAWDAAAGAMILFGGQNESGVSDTWAYNKGNWTQLFPSVSPPAGGGPMVYDAASSEVVLFGGRNPLCIPNMDCNETWTFSSPRGNWTLLNLTVAPPARAFDAMAYDNLTGTTLIFGGYCDSQPYLFGDLWTFNGTSWSQLNSSDTPPPMAYGAMAFDPLANETVLVGGFNRSSPLASSWELNSSDNWSQVAPQVHALLPVLDVNTTTELQTFTAPGPGGWTFKYSGLPSGCVGVSTATLNCTPPIAGKYGIGVIVSDAFGATGVASSSLTVNSPPTVSLIGPMAERVTLGSRAYVNVSLQNGTPPYSLSFQGLPLGCLSSNVSNYNCVPAVVGNFTVNVSMSDRFGEVGSTKLWLTVTAGSSSGSGSGTGGYQGTRTGHSSSRGPGLFPLAPTGRTGVPSPVIPAMLLAVGAVVGVLGSEIVARRRKNTAESRRLRDELTSAGLDDGQENPRSPEGSK